MLTSTSYLKYITLYIIIVLSITSCQFSDMEPLKIRSITPSESQLPNFNNFTLEVNFNKSVDIESVEKSISLSDSGVNLLGSFQWSNHNKTVLFTPAIELDEYKKYKLTIKTSAEDENGNSLKETYIHYFYIQEDIVRPTITSFKPNKDASTIEEYEPIIVKFSEPIPPDSWLNNFSTTPTLEGFHSWSDDKTEYTFTPTDSLVWNQEYTIKIPSQVNDYYGNTLNEDKTYKVLRGAIETPVTLDSISSSDNSTRYIPDDTTTSDITYNLSLETDEKFVLTFNRDVNLSSIKSYITFEPPISYDIKEIKDEYSTIVTIEPKDPFIHSSIHSITIKEGIEDRYGNKLLENSKYYLKFNGSRTTPPRIDTDQIYFFNEFQGVSGEHMKIEPYGSFGDIGFPEATPNNTFLDLPLLVSDKSRVMLDKQKVINSFRENFSLTTTNNCSNIDIRAVSFDTDNSLPGYHDDKTTIITPGDNLIVVRVYLKYTSNANMGNIILTLDKNFSDGEYTPLETLSITYNKDEVP